MAELKEKVSQPRKTAFSLSYKRRLDFCCSVYHPLPKNLVSRVQTIQNACAKFVTGAKKFDSATAARFKLHWLPVPARSKFRILTYAYRIVHAKDSIPKYLSEPFSTQKHERVTRNNLSNTLHCSYKFRLVTVGCRSVYCTILELWNSLLFFLHFTLFRPINVHTRQIRPCQ